MLRKESAVSGGDVFLELLDHAAASGRWHLAAGPADVQPAVQYYAGI